MLGAAQAADASAPANEADSAGEGRAPSSGVPKLAVDLIDRSRFQPRRHFDEDKLQELADSIASQGVVQPIVVRPMPDGRYELIAGERRWRASQLAGLGEIPAVVREVDDQAAMAMALIENIQRADLNPLEEAAAMQRLLSEFGLTHQQVAQTLGKSRTTITNLLRLLELNPEVKDRVDRGELDMGHARALLGLKGDQQTAAAQEVIEHGMSVRETEALVRRYLEPVAPVRPAGKQDSAMAIEPDPDVRRLLNELSEKLGAQVQIKQHETGKGKLIIGYHSLDELQGILSHFESDRRAS